MSLLLNRFRVSTLRHQGSRVQRRLHSDSQFSRMVGRALAHRPWFQSSPALSSQLRSFCQQATIAPKRSEDAASSPSSAPFPSAATATASTNAATSSPSPTSSSSAATAATAGSTNVGKIEPRMRILFTCAQCDHRSASEFTRHSYEHGVVLVRCPGCKVFHLIADNKGWFRDERVTVEDLAREKGVSLQQLANGASGSLEVSAEDLALLLKAQNSQSTKGFTPSKEESD